MLIDNLFSYEKGTIEKFNKPSSELYYFFDYDDRSANVNMDFQHFHRFYEIHLLLGKEAAHIIEGTLYKQKMFDLVLLPPSKLHKSQYPEGPAVKRLVINFRFPDEPQPALAKEQKELFSIFYSPVPIYRFDRNVQEQLAAHLNTIFRLLKGDSHTKLLQLHLEFQQFLLCIYNNREKNTYNQTEDDSLTAKIYSITSYIHAHYSEDLSLEKLAKEFFISTCYLSHQFKAITGFNITTYIQMTRIRNAQQMLLEEDMKITEVATACGFNSFSQFNRVFNKFCGVSPSKMKTAAENKTYEEYSSIPIINPS
ncbi:MAG: AraC family transcriptional regulator [Lachnospiraceae bacterium]